MLVPAEVLTVASSDHGNAVLVKPKGADIAVPIFIGPAEADAIKIILLNYHIPRPLTHDLFISTLNHTNINVKRVEITDLIEGTFYGRLIVTKSGKEISIDARPSDCIAIAVRVKCSIFIDEAVVDEAGITITRVKEQNGQSFTLEKSETHLSKLKKRLNRAVEEENYEEAAKLRDEIKKLEKKA